MKGRRLFSVKQASEIRGLLDETRRSERQRQKSLRNILRKKCDFYITDFDTSGTGFDRADFDSCVADGRITIEG